MDAHRHACWKKRWGCPIGLLLLVIAACGDGVDGANALMRFVAVDPGAECPGGGTQIDSGLDDNANGQLDAAEIDHTTVICSGQAGQDGNDGDDGSNGASGPTGPTGPTGATGPQGDAGDEGVDALTEITVLETHDPDCPFGGLRFDSGHDANGNGSLDPDEISATEVVCNGEPAFHAEEWTPPEGPEGAFTLTAAGGSGGDASSGDGDHVWIALDHGSLGGHIKIFDTGLADASFAFPATVPVYLGTNPLEVTEDLLVVVRPAADHTDLNPATGGYHMHLGESEYGARIYDWDGAEHHAVTGVSVADGATLTLESNWSTGTRINLESDFHNAGTLTIDDSDFLSIHCDVFYGEGDSTIDLVGADAAAGGEDGEDGADLRIEAYEGEWGTSHNGGAIFNAGTIITEGGQGDDGGLGGDIFFDTELVIYNTGPLRAGGGRGEVGAGATGGDVTMETLYGSIFNAGPIVTAGGSGATEGGWGAPVSLSVGTAGHVRNSGDISTSGADADSDCTVGCQGGDAGAITLAGQGGEVVNSGNLTSRGGSGADGNGGDGSNVDISLATNYGWEGTYLALGDIVLSGTIDTSGGGGNAGGSAGHIAVELNAEYVPDNQEIVLLGYTDIVTDGGAGSAGGDAGYIFIRNAAADSNQLDYGPSGGIVNYAAISAAGGDGDGSGGDGACIEILTDDEYGYATDAALVLNYGDLTTAGGDGEDAGFGGCVKLWGYSRVENDGDINAAGGISEDTGGQGGDGAYATSYAWDGDNGVYLLSDLGPVINTGTIAANGGDATAENGDGGDGELIEIVGEWVESSGDLSVAGGAGGTTGDEANGGDAGAVFLYGVFDGTENTGTIDISGGEAAESDGADGECFIDGANDTDAWLSP